VAAVVGTALGAIVASVAVALVLTRVTRLDRGTTLLGTLP
jgi:hypothetical protein